MNTHTNPNHTLQERLRQMEPFLSATIRGQEHVTRRICAALQRAELGLCKPARPKGSFLFLGPKGVGKTETTLAFTGYLLGDGALQRFDMSEYQLQDTLEGFLDSIARAVRRHNRGTLLFDEIEKAHPRIFDVFLQILDAARLTTSGGETLDLSGFYVVFTSNLGCSDVIDVAHSGVATVERHVLAMARKHFRPELFARIQEKLVFRRLDYEVQLQIAADSLAREVAFLGSRGHRLEVGADALPFLVRKGFHPKLGARRYGTPRSVIWARRLCAISCKVEPAAAASPRTATRTAFVWNRGTAWKRPSSRRRDLFGLKQSRAQFPGVKS